MFSLFMFCFVSLRQEHWLLFATKNGNFSRSQCGVGVVVGSRMTLPFIFTTHMNIQIKFRKNFVFWFFFQNYEKSFFIGVYINIIAKEVYQFRVLDDDNTFNQEISLCIYHLLDYWIKFQKSCWFSSSNTQI